MSCTDDMHKTKYKTKLQTDLPTIQTKLCLLLKTKCVVSN